MRKNNEGFTLIELLVVVSLLAIAVGLTGDTLITIVRTFNKTTVKNEIEQNANFVSQKLIKELRNATGISALGSETLVQNASSNEVTFTDSDDNEITYSVDVDSGIMYRDFASGGDDALTESNPPYGVTVSCGSPDCFTLVETNPQVLRISLIMTQAGSAGSKIFEGSVEIEDTIVIRNTY